eukprot:8150848-Karenia_brevis.AAC.1
MLDDAHMVISAFYKESTPRMLSLMSDLARGNIAVGKGHKQTRGRREVSIWIGQGNSTPAHAGDDAVMVDATLSDKM